MDVQDAGRRRGDVREGISLRITSLETEEDRQRRNRQQSEMKKALLEQVQNKERLKQEARQRELEEDRKQEEKIRKQLAELNEDFQREAGGEKRREEPRASPARRQPKQRSPTPVPVEVEVKGAPLAEAPARLVYVKELWREKEELNQKQVQLQQLISELRENATAKQHNPSTDFEAIRKETLGRPTPITRAPSDPWATLRDSSRFISSTRVKPLAQVGHRLVTLDRSAKTLPGMLMRQTQDYSMVESAEVRSQLGKLDGLLDFCRGGGEVPQTMPRLQIQRQGDIQSLSPTHDSPELRGNAQSVSLDFMLPSN